MKKLTHRFVEFVPRPLEDGVLYISLRLRIASHKSACGCGNEVATNLSPRGWQLIYDGETVSLRPSIGNWNFKCQSHYWITRDTVQWAEKWSGKRIQMARERDEQDVMALGQIELETKNSPQGENKAREGKGILSSLRRRIFRGKEGNR